VDDRALAVARENSERNHLQHLSSFERFDLFEDDVGVLRRRLGEFDMVVSNPPYVSSKDMKEVKGKWWEGKFALQGKLKGSLEGPQQNLSLHTDGRGGLDYARMTNGNGNGNDEDHDEKVDEDNDDDGLSFYRRIHEIYSLFLSLTRPPSIPKLVLEVGAKQSPPVKLMYADQGRLEIQKETPRRKDLSTPKLERGDMAGTERSIWIYQG